MIFVAYIIFLSLCVSYLLVSSAKSSGIIKLIAITLLAHGYATSAVTLQQVSGYPTISSLPREFKIIYARAVEGNSNPFIEIWVSYDMSNNNKFYAWFSMAGSMNDLTRVYRMPYNEKNHEMVLKIQKQVIEGKTVGIMISDEEGNGEVDLRDGMQNYRIRHKGYRIQK